jgi:hypothetical protein
MVAQEFSGMPHEVAGASWLEPRLGSEVAWLVGAHVAARLCLLEHDGGYAALLSEESRKSAIGQHAPELEGLTREHGWLEPLPLRRWDDAAKQPDAKLADPMELLAIIEPLAERSWESGPQPFEGSAPSLADGVKSAPQRQLVAGSSLVQYMHLVAATGSVADKQYGQVLVGAGSP